MLRALDVSNLVLIEKASLELGEGFTCLTGETGAGKSMLVDAIELLVGGRGDAGLVRDGAERAELSAEFEVKEKTPLADWLVEADLAGDPGTLILRRSIDRSGRSRCFINGHAATLAQLKSAGEHLIDIHGQHEHQSLLRPAAQRALLDAQAGAEDLARQTADAYRDWKRLQAVAERSREKFRAAGSRARRAEGSDFRFEKARLARGRVAGGLGRAHQAAARLELARRRAVRARSLGRGRGGSAQPARRGGEPVEGAFGARRPI